MKNFSSIVTVLLPSVEQGEISGEWASQMKNGKSIYDRTFRLHKSFLIWYQFSFSTHFRCSNKSGFSQLYFDHHVYQMYIMDYISVHICIRTDERDLSKSSFLHLIKAETLVEFISSISTQVPLSPFHSLHSNMLHKKPLKRQTTSQK